MPRTSTADRKAEAARRAAVQAAVKERKAKAAAPAESVWEEYTIPEVTDDVKQNRWWFQIDPTAGGYNADHADAPMPILEAKTWDDISRWISARLARKLSSFEKQTLPALEELGIGVARLQLTGGVVKHKWLTMVGAAADPRDTNPGITKLEAKPKKEAAPKRQNPVREANRVNAAALQEQIDGERARLVEEAVVKGYLSRENAEALSLDALRSGSAAYAATEEIITRNNAPTKAQSARRPAKTA